MKKVRVFSNSNKVELTFSTWELLFIVTSLIKVIRLDKGNIKFNYRVYKIIDKQREEFIPCYISMFTIRCHGERTK